MTKEIKLSELKSDIDSGMKRDALKKKYTDGNNNALNGILKQAGLKIRAFKTNATVFKLINDLEVTETSSNLAVAKEIEEAVEQNSY